MVFQDRGLASRGPVPLPGRQLPPKAVPEAGLPLIGADGMIRTEPIKVLETRSLPRQGTLVTQWRVEWANLHPDDSTWEDANFIKKVFPAFYAETIRSWFPETST